MFVPSLIVVFESLNCPPCEKIDLKVIVTAGKRFKYAGKLKNLQDPKDFSEKY